MSDNVQLHEERTEDGVTRRVIREKPKIDHLVGRGLVPFFVEGTDDLVNEDLTNVHSSSAQGDMGAVEARTWNPEGYWEDAKLVGHGGAAPGAMQGQVPYVDDAGNTSTSTSTRKGKGKGKNGKKGANKVSPKSSQSNADMQRITAMLTRSAQKQGKQQQQQQQQQQQTPSKPAVPTYASVTKSTPKKQTPLQGTPTSTPSKGNGKGKGKARGKGKNGIQAQIVAVPSRAANILQPTTQLQQQQQVVNPLLSASMVNNTVPQAVLMPAQAASQPSMMVQAPYSQGMHPGMPMQQQQQYLHMANVPQQQQQQHHPHMMMTVPAPAPGSVAPAAAPTPALLTPALLTPADIYSASPVLDTPTPQTQTQTQSRNRRPSADVDSTSRFAGNAFQAAPAPDALPIPVFGDSAPTPTAQDTAAMTRDLRSMLGVM